MSGAPQVSVVMGVRNGGDGLAPSLESILAQRDVELELIVVDDGSTDGTAERLAAFAARDARVRVSSQEPSGLTGALRRGCGMARAPLIARNDAGDRSHPERLRRQKDALERHAAVALVSCRTACVGPAREPLFIERGRSVEELPVAILAGDPPTIAAGPTSHGSVLFRAEDYRAVGGYRDQFALGQDWDLWLRLAERGSYFQLGRALYARSFWPDSLSFAFHDLQVEFGRLALEAARARRSGASDGAVLEAAAKLSERMTMQRARRRARGVALGNYHLGQLLRRRGDPRARTYFRRAVGARPTLLRGWVRLAQSMFARGTVESPGALGFDWAVAASPVEPASGAQ